jgi:hypothetical protein
MEAAMTDITDGPGSTEPTTPKPKPPAIVSLGGRRRILFVFAAPAIVAFLVMLLVWKFPDANLWNVPELPLFLGCLAVILVSVAAIFLTWRCPECGSYLGRDPRPVCCARCGVYFED